MKKLVFLLVCMFTVQVATAGNDRPISFEQLPQASQKFIKEHFPDVKVAFAKVEKDIFDTEYAVVFVNGDKLEFNNKGDWKEISCKRSSVPVKAIPEQIKQYLDTNYPDVKVLVMEKDRYEYELKLANFWEITFDKQYNVIDVDYDD